MDVIKIMFAVMIMITLLFGVLGVLIMASHELSDVNNDIVIENEKDSGIRYRFTDISDKGFDCKTIMWTGQQLTCVDWDGVRV